MEGALTLRRNTAGVEEEKGDGLAGWEVGQAGPGIRRAGPGSLLAEAGLGPPHSRKGCLRLTWLQRDCGARGFRARLSLFPGTRAARPFPGRCPPGQPAGTARTSAEPGRWRLGARTHTRVAGCRLQEKARLALVDRQEACLKTQDTSRRNRKAGRWGCRPYFQAVARWLGVHLPLWIWGAEHSEAPRKRCRLS